MTREAKIAAFLRDRAVYLPVGAGILWASYFASVLLGDGHGAFNMKGQLTVADHLAFYTAAQLIPAGRGVDAYNPEIVQPYQAAMFPAGRWDRLEAFRNPPFYALLYAPTARLPYPASAWLWAALSVGFIWLGVRWAVKSESVARPFLWLFAFYPTFAAISFGQNTPISFAVFAAAYRLLAAGRPFAAGLVAGLLWYKPQLLLGLAVWGLLDFRRLWPCAVGVVVTGAALFAGTYPFIPEAWEGFYKSLTANVAFTDFEQWKMHNPLAFWRLLLPGAEWLHLPLAALCSLAVLFGFFRLWQARRHDLPVMFGAAVFVTLLASPHALIYEWALLGLTWLLWKSEFRRAPDAWLVLVAAACAVTFISSNFAELQLDQFGAAVQLSVPVLGWVGWRAVRLLRAGDTMTVPAPAPPR